MPGKITNLHNMPDIWDNSLFAVQESMMNFVIRYVIMKDFQ